MILALTVASASAWAKLPVPPVTEESTAKAEAAKVAKAASAKADTDALARAQGQVVDKYTSHQKAKGIIVKPTPIAPPIAPPVTTPAPAAPADKK
ncbi:MAG: formate dehydrogenase [Betaproteobacteria bacterium HGW-Betaproteobacteria-10]|nr:MAG: formate dehydrogenase [Betaproteobacteria bacterium HGW-Betaproteobacteria-10]